MSQWHECVCKTEVHFLLNIQSILNVLIEFLINNGTDHADLSGRAVQGVVLRPLA